MSSQENKNTQSEELIADGQIEVNEDVGEQESREVQGVSNEPEQTVDDIDTLRDELEREREQSRTNLDKALRVQAEMENLRKRTTRDIENAHKYVLERFVNELLPVIDSMELGANAMQSTENVDDLRKGMELTLKMFSSTMEKFGVKVVDPQDEKFNPERHEAVSMQEMEGTDSGIVVSVMQKGYELNGRLVRPAMVVVSK